MGDVNHVYRLNDELEYGGAISKALNSADPKGFTISYRGAHSPPAATKEYFIGTKLHEAIVFSRFEEVKELLRHGADPNLEPVTRQGEYTMTPLLTAVAFYDFFGDPAEDGRTHKVIEALLEGKADINLRGRYTGFTPLGRAVLKSSLEEAKLAWFLISHGAKTKILIDPKKIYGDRFKNKTIDQLMRETKRRTGDPKFKKYVALTKIQNKFLDSRLDPNTRYGQLHIAEGYKAVHSKVFDNSLRTMDQLIAASERKKAFEEQSPRKITKAHESPFGNRKKYSRKNKKK